MCINRLCVGGAEGILAAANADNTDDAEVTEEHSTVTTDDACVTAETAVSKQSSSTSKPTQKVQTAVGGKRSKPKAKTGSKAKSLSKKNANTLSFGDDD